MDAASVICDPFGGIDPYVIVFHCNCVAGRRHRGSEETEAGVEAGAGHKLVVRGLLSSKTCCCPIVL